jgi:hypothetical protein
MKVKENHVKKRAGGNKGERGKGKKISKPNCRSNLQTP